MSLFIPRFRDLLDHSGKQQKEICGDLGISPQKLSKWKTGYNEPNFDDLIMIAKYFDVSADYLLGIIESDDCESFCIKNENSPLENFSAEDKSLVEDFQSLPRAQRAQAVEYVHYLAERFGSDKKKKA